MFLHCEITTFAWYFCEEKTQWFEVTSFLENKLMGKSALALELAYIRIRYIRMVGNVDNWFAAKNV